MIRTNMATKLANLPSGKVFLQVLGCGIEDAAPCIFLFTDSKRYMFNCGEGAQRLFTEYKVKLSKLNTIFFTQNKWSHLGGFLGMSMTLRDIGKDHIGIHGPVGLNQVIHGARSFLYRENLCFDVTEYSAKRSEPFYDDELVIKPIFVQKGQEEDASSNGSINQYESVLGYEDSVKRCHVRHLQQSHVVCYATKLKDYPGKLLPKVAISLGVPKGPMFRLLKDGQTVTLPNGKKVAPEEVTEPPIPGPSFLIIDCPNSKYITAIANNESFKRYQKDGAEPATVVIHMTQKNVLRKKSYKEWMERFHEDTYHCILDKEELSKCHSVFQSQCLVQYKLNQVHPKTFPIIELWRDQESEDSVKEQMKIKSNRTYLCGNLMKFNLRPSAEMGPDESEALKRIEAGVAVEEALAVLKEFEGSLEGHSELETIKNRGDIIADPESEAGLRSNSDIRKSAVEVNGNIENSVCLDQTMVGEKRKRDSSCIPDEKNIEILSAKMNKCEPSMMNGKAGSEADSYVERCSCPRVASEVVEKYPRIVFLGTGASIPSKYRNVSSILIHTGPATSILLDCGEGSYGQIVNHYGSEAENIIKRLQFIFVTHMHADHHLGVIRILKQHRKLLGKRSQNYNPPLIAAPQKFCRWLEEYGGACESLDFRFADCKFFCEESSGSLLAEHVPGLTKVVFAPVDHHTEAYGIALYHKDGWKITYSGDTEPCQNLVDIGKDSTVLIHEATFEDGMEDEAKEKHHSTFGQALDIAARMNAKNILLTHFSQRYAKLPAMKNQVPVGIAFDHMEVHPDDVPEICKLLPKLQTLFPEVDKTR